MKWGKKFPRRPDGDTEAVIARAAEISAHLDRRTGFMPGAFWADISRQNIEMLQNNGIENFKRFLPQNYFNWVVEGANDPKFAKLLRDWADSPSPLPLQAELVGDAGLSSLNNTMYLETPEAGRGYTLFVGLLWWKAVSGDTGNKAIRLLEPAVGNPIRIQVGGRLISQDLANSLREYTRFSHMLTPSPHAPKPVLAEIGAGYGRLGYATLKAQPARYWVFDISPALAVSEWYLERAIRGLKIFRWRPFDAWSEVGAELEQADIAFFTPDQLQLVPAGAINTIAAVSTLHELRPEQSRSYVELMTAKAHSVYLKNWTEWTNEADGVLFRSSDLQPPDGWFAEFDRIDDVIGSFTEKLWRRAP